MVFFESILPQAIAFGVIYLFGCTGEIVMEKSGHLNLGIPGVMCFGALGGCYGASLCMSMFADDYTKANYFLLVLFVLIFSAILSAIAGLIYGFLTVTLKCNQNVTGLALTIFGGGFADFFMTSLYDKNRGAFSAGASILKTGFPFASNLGVVGNIFFSHGFFVYFAIIISIITAFVLKRSKLGRHLRAVGENPSTADAAGINVTRYKYGAILTGSIIAGFAGAFYAMDYNRGTWENSSTVQGYGWLAIALVIFVVWKPILAIFGSILFGLLYILPTYVSGNDISTAVQSAIELIPYISTIIVLIITSIFGSKSIQPPASLGLPYFREER